MKLHRNIKVFVYEHDINCKKLAELLDISPCNVSHYIKSGYQILEHDTGQYELHAPNRRFKLN